MKIHDWYCHGLSASSDNHRRTVAGEIDPQIPSVTACRASSGHDHRDSGSPLSLGGVQAIALTRATCTGVNTGSATRPFRITQRRHPRCGAPAVPPLADGVLADPQRPRDPRVRLSRAAASTIPARGTSRCSVRPARTSRASSRRCEPVNVIRSGLVGDIQMLHDEFPLATSASPVTGWMLVSDTPIRHDHDHGRTTRIDENVPATAAVRPRPRTMAATGRCRRAIPRRVRLRHRHLPDGDTMPLMRLRYGGSAARWGFAIYLASKDGYEDSVLPTGDLAGAPEDALDTACGLYLGDPTAWT